ncbi:MAG: N-acetylmuramoyl-L-alanine amidase [Rikenellaceae bacterium]
MNDFSKIILFFSFLLCFSAHAQEVKQGQIKIKTVVLDAGHGGNDSGATCGSIYEKDIALSVTLKLGKMIKEAYPDVNVVYTRSTDVFIPLSQRGIIANKAKGDLFISIHVNAAASPYAEGTETYTLGLHKSAASLAVAQKENSVITLESDYKKDYGDFSPNNPESYIMFSMGQQGYMRESIDLSYIIQQHYKKNFNNTNRGIKQAGFLVLWRASMPSVLTELSFISNPSDRSILQSRQGQEKYARSLFDAFSEYKKNAEKSFEYNTKTKQPAENVDPKETKEITEVNKNSNGVPEGSFYALQLISSRHKIERNKQNFGDYAPDVIEVFDNDYYKYFVGLVNSNQEILSLQKKIRVWKYKDAYPVGFHDGKIVKASEIKMILKK